MSRPASALFHHRTSYVSTPHIGLRCFFCTVPCKSLIFSCLFAELIKECTSQYSELEKVSSRDPTGWMFRIFVLT